MSCDIDALKQQIQELRQKLKEIAENKSFTDPEVVGASQMLDVLLNEYERLLRKKKM
ncbi:MAG TPA: aspartyl-phosphate phosphatase Spo0E family protein [Bacillota bacterium]|jgi:hypothetical protein|nr:aspartyl-phosphate phosphatase Spo0E family protein [Bacillota bacterium]HOL09814.1 aspartyl-phosphate phosphatase Spo0E family protein [Bacillota bacterium]HPO98754.1 aspartyl-phosphate phosphatase Spo0E family protein [Bacillota bacterium]